MCRASEPSKEKTFQRGLEFQHFCKTGFVGLLDASGTMCTTKSEKMLFQFEVR